MDLISVLVVLICTLIAIFAALYAYGMSNLQDIKDNWVKYRCNPVYMPMAGMVGSDIGTNFTNCTMQSVNTYAGFAMDPIYQNFGILTNIIQDIMGAMNDMRAAVTGASSGFLGIIQSTFGKLQNTLQTTMQLFGRVRTIMNRMMATFAVIMNIVSTGVQTGESVKNGPIGQAADFFCFHPDTQIDLPDRTLAIRKIQPGTELAGGVIVKSTMMFTHRGPMYTLGDVVVSGNHKVWHIDEWIRVEDHPNANLSPPCDVVYCLNTDNHTIASGGFIFKDYEETSDPAILSTFFRMVEIYYGNAHTPSKIKNPAMYCYTGVLPETPVILEDGSEIPAKNVKLGSILKYGGDVQGLLRHKVMGRCENLAPGTWMLDEDGVTPAMNCTDTNTEFEYIQFVTEHCHYAVNPSGSGEFVILDDHEVPDDDIHTWRDNEIQKEVA